MITVDNEIYSLELKLSKLEKQAETAVTHSEKLKERIQKELHQASNRVYLMHPKMLKGHYLATDNAIILLAICASFGVTAGILGGALLLTGSA